MAVVTVKQMPAFKKATKKLHRQKLKSVNDAIRSIIKNPHLGKEKKGDLAGILSINLKQIIKKCCWLTNGNHNSDYC